MKNRKFRQNHFGQEDKKQKYPGIMKQALTASPILYRFTDKAQPQTTALQTDKTQPTA